MHVMTVGQLRAALNGVPDDTLVLINQERDHEYEPGFSASMTTALRQGDTFTEDIYVPAVIGEATDYGVRIPAFVVGA